MLSVKNHRQTIFFDNMKTIEQQTDSLNATKALKKTQN